LARVEATNDPMTQIETTDLGQNVKNNNNIAWKNLSIVDLIPNKPIHATVAVGNSSDIAETYDLEFMPASEDIRHPITKECEITVQLDTLLYQEWLAGTKEMYGLKEIGNGNFVILSDKALIKGIHLSPHIRGTIKLSFNFLSEKLSEKTIFKYYAVQKQSSNGAVIGGELFQVQHKQRTKFIADAGIDKEISVQENITISATDISEAAIYNWYDTNGNLIFTGKNLSISPEITKKYKLEVIATADGFKDYD
jgi:acyl-CoA-binding protein